MSDTVSVSIIVPVYEEEYNIVPNIDDIISKLGQFGVKEFELLIFASTQRLSALPDYLTADKKILLFDHEGCNEIGGIFARGIKLASEEYVGLITPYNQFSLEGLGTVFEALRKNDMVATYIKNPKARPWHRTLASVVNTLLVNLLFGLRIKYYHECFYRSRLVKKVRFTTASHAAMVEAAIWIAKSGASIAHVPFVMIPHNFKSKSRAFRFKNIIEIFKTYIQLFWQIRVLGKRIDLY